MLRGNFKPSSIFVVRMLSAASMVSLFLLYKGDQDVLRQLNLMLISIALLDLGMQQASLMRLISKSLWLLNEALLVFLLAIVMLFSDWATEARLILVCYLVNVLQASVNTRNRISELVAVVPLRIAIIVGVIELEHFWFAASIFLLMAVGSLKVDSRGAKFSEYGKRRIEMAGIGIGAVLMEQLVRVDSELPFEESMFMLILGYILSLASVVQASLTQIFFSSREHETLASVVSIWNLILSYSLLLFGLCVAGFALGLQNVSYFVLGALVLAASLLMRFGILRRSFADRGFRFFSIQSILMVLLSCLLLFLFELSPLHCQILIATTIICSTGFRVWKSKI